LYQGIQHRVILFNSLTLLFVTSMLVYHFKLSKVNSIRAAQIWSRNKIAAVHA